MQHLDLKINKVASTPHAIAADKKKKKPTRGDSFTNSIGMKFVYIVPGTFKMGSPPSEKGREENETLHQVTLTKGYWLQTTEVTQGQWEAVMGSNPSYFKNCGKDCPVEDISWYAANDFIRNLNQMDHKVTYRLPTEAEWEYAARAGSTTRYCFGDDEKKLDEYAWHMGNSGEKSHPVAQKRPNAWGLYDVHGNVFELCSDGYGDYSAANQTDPKGPKEVNYHVLRSGGWDFSPQNNRSAFRSKVFMNLHYYSLGFRVAADP